MTSESLLPALPYAAEAVKVFEAACRQVVEGDLAAARELLDQLDDSVLRAHFNEAVGTDWVRRNALADSPMATPVGKDLRQTVRMPTDAETIFDRDGWRCRWCGTPVISTRAIKRMATDCPTSFHHGTANVDIHGLTLCCAVSLDHVVPHSFGGTNDADNVVTACWPCQFGRGNDTIDRVDLADPRDRAPFADDWDGCGWFFTR